MTQPQKIELMVESVGRLLRRGALANIVKIFNKARAVEVATVLRGLPRPERRTVFRALFEHDFKKSSDALSELRPEVGVALLEGWEVPDIARLLQEMSPDDAALFIDALPVELREELLHKIREKEEVHELLGFPSETAGRIMTPNAFALREDVTVGEAIAALQNRSKELEMVFYLYVIDDRSHLVGVISLRQLLLNPPGTPLKKIMSADVISVRTHTDQEEVARLVANYNLLGVPVVDDENKLAGLITVDDVVDVIREEATEDIFALVGVEADDRALGDPLKSFRRRIPWLMTSLMTAMIAVAVVRQFERPLKEFIALAFILPLVAAVGGHAASQTLTVMVRGIAIGEVTGETSRRALWKECMVGMINGLVVGCAGALAIGLWFWDWVLGAVMFACLFLLLLVAALAGAVIPMTLKKLNFDPAMASSVFVITVTDVLGFLSFLGLGTLALEWLK